MIEPTDEQLDELWDEIGGYYNLYPEVRDTIREALHRWGNMDIEEDMYYD
jgi:hypothetical protein